jgi:hypothetical protein
MRRRRDARRGPVSAGRARARSGLTRSNDDIAKLRSHGVVPIVGDLDALRSLERLRYLGPTR